MFLLAIDVGNTQITLGAFHDRQLTHTWSLHTHPQSTADELGLQLHGLLRYAPLGYNEIEGIVIASVVPALDAPLSKACSSYLKQTPLFVNSKTHLGIANKYKNPEEVGADRLVNAVAVHELLGGPAIVVDFGTATTFDCVSRRGEYIGGVIAPGLQIAHDALTQRTAKLSKVPFDIPDKVLGRTTKESLQSGLFFGYIALVEGMLQRLVKEMRGSPKIVATGGLSTVIGPRLKEMTRIMPALTLDGLRIIWERNKKSGGSHETAKIFRSRLRR
jgi:type III pantothenate kinase